jgi:type I restriction enzyme, S subunit
MSDRTVSFSELASEDLIEVGAGRPRSVLDQYPSLPILRVADVLDGRIECPPQDRVSGGSRKAIGPKISKPGDVVLTVKGTVGRVTMMPSDGPDFAYSPQLCYFRPANSGPLRSRYLYYWFKSLEFWNQADALKGQTDMADYLSLSDIQALRIRIPPLDRQDSVIDVLGFIDDNIAVNDLIINSVQELGQAIFAECFGDALKFLTRGTALPDGWQAAALGDHLSVLETGRRPRGGVGGYASGVPSIGAESITSMARFDFAKVRYVPVEYFNSMRQGIVEDYDILLYKDGGRPGSFEPHVSMFGNGYPFSRMCINEHVYRIRLRVPAGQEFGYFWLSSEPLMVEMRNRGTGVAIPGINSQAVRSLPLVIPPSDKLTNFGCSTRALIDRALSCAAERRTLAELRDTLLPGLMSGAIRVREAEKVVGEVT